jgi:hypothetical protein
MYALSFCVPLAVTTLALPWRPAIQAAPQEPLWIQRSLTQYRWIMQVASSGVLAVATAALGVGVFP